MDQEELGRHKEVLAQNASLKKDLVSFKIIYKNVLKF